MTFPVVEPQPVGCPKVVAHVDVRRPVAVQIAECHRIAPIPRRASQRFAVFVQKCPVGPGQRREMALPVVEIYQAGFAVLLKNSIGEDEAVPQRRRHGHLAVFPGHVDLVKLHAISDRLRAIIGHIQIKRAVAINVRQGQCHRGKFAQRASIFAAVHKRPIALVRETQHPVPRRAHQQIQPAVPVDVRKHRPPADPVAADYPGIWSANPQKKRGNIKPDTAAHFYQCR